MLELAAVTFGFLTNFVLFSVQQNNRNQRPCPLILVYFGYLLVGVCTGVATLLAGFAIIQFMAESPAMAGVEMVII